MSRIHPLLPLYMLLFTFIGGFADASSFLLSGVFTGHLTGNIVLSTVYCVHHQFHLLAHSIPPIIGFISGTILGVWFRAKNINQIRYKTTIALFFQLSILIFIFLIKIHYQTAINNLIFFSGLSFTLGLQNGVINSINKIGIHSSYITGMTTTLINNYLTLQQKDPDYSQRKSQCIMQFFVIVAFVIGALVGVTCIYFWQLIGFSILGLLLVTAIILSIYLQHHNII